MFKDIITSSIMPEDRQPSKFDLEIHLLEQRLKLAQANTDKVIEEIRNNG